MAAARNSIREHDMTSLLSGVDDAELLRRARRGEEPAFHALVDRHAQYLFGVAYALLGHAADAEDAVQETLAGAFQGLGGFGHRSSVRTWLVRILVRQAARIRRGASRAMKLTDTVAEPSTTGPAPAVEAKLDVMLMLESLSVEHREVIVLRELHGMSYGEMAEALGVPQGTVESRLHRARAELRQRYREYL